MLYSESIVGNYTCSKCGDNYKASDIVFTTPGNIPDKFPTQEICENLETFLCLPAYHTIDPYTTSKDEIVSMYANELSNKLLDMYKKELPARTGIMTKIKFILDTKYNIKSIHSKWIKTPVNDKDLVNNYELLQKLCPGIAKYSVFVPAEGKHFIKYVEDVKMYARLMDKQQLYINHFASNENVREELQRRFTCICKNCIGSKDMKSKNDEYEAQVEKLQRDLTIKVSDIEEMKQTCDDLHAMNTSLEKKIKDMEQKLSEKSCNEATIKSMNEKLIEQSATIDKLKTDIKMEEDKNDELVKKLAEKDSEIHKLESKVQDNMDIITQMNSDQESMDEKMNELRKEISKLNESYRHEKNIHLQYIQDVKRLVSIQDDQANLITSKEIEIRDLKSKLQNASKNEELIKKLAEKDSEIHKLESKVQEHMDIITQMNQESETKDTEIANLKERIDKIKGIMSGFAKMSE